MFNPIKNIRKKLSDKEVCLGIFHLTANAIVSEVISTLPLEWVVYDMEASPADKWGLIHFLQSMKGSSVAPFVRSRSCSHDHIEQILDAGTAGIIIPKVDTREICEKALAAVKYPSVGKRGVNPVRASRYFTDVKGYFNNSNDETLVFVQVESRSAVENIEEILSVPGVDGVFIGCGDLSMDLGCPGDMTSDRLLQAIETVRKACADYEKIPGVFAYDLSLAQKFIKDGFKFVAFGNDIGLLRKSIINDYETLRKL